MSNPHSLEQILQLWRMRNFPMTTDLVALSESLFSVEKSVFTFRSEKDMPSLLCHFPVTNQEASKLRHFPLDQFQ